MTDCGHENREFPFLQTAMDRFDHLTGQARLRLRPIFHLKPGDSCELGGVVRHHWDSAALSLSQRGTYWNLDVENQSTN